MCVCVFVCVCVCVCECVFYAQSSRTVISGRFFSPDLITLFTLFSGKRLVESHQGTTFSIGRSLAELWIQLRSQARDYSFG